jgi:flagellar biosynthesis/type III secretory pathway protein FliH
LRNYVLFEKPETNRKFDNQIKESDKAGIMNTLEYVKMEGKEEGFAEGQAEGFTRGLANAVVALLANTEFSIEKIAGILGVSTTFVIKVNDESRVRK